MFGFVKKFIGTFVNLNSSITTLSKSFEILSLKLQYFEIIVLDLAKDVEELKRKRDPDSDFSKKLKRVTPIKH